MLVFLSGVGLCILFAATFGTYICFEGHNFLLASKLQMHKNLRKTNTKLGMLLRL